MTAEENTHCVSQETDRLDREKTLELRTAEGHIHDISLGHYEKLAVLQAGVFALSVTFLAGLSSQATTHHVSILHLWVLISCWISMVFSIFLCVIHNWLRTESFIALNTTWQWSGRKSILESRPNSLRTSALQTLEAMLYSSGIMEKWQGDSARKFSKFYPLARWLEYVVHGTFVLGLFCLLAFVIGNVKVFLP